MNDFEALNEHCKQKFNHDRRMFMEHAKAHDDGGWTKHTEYHWSRTLNGHRLDFWPSRNKFQYKGKVKRGDVHAYIRRVQK